MPQRLVIAEWWDSFARDLLPNGVSSAQKTEMRRAFYAGSQATFHGVMRSLSSGEGVTEEDMKFMANLELELAQFRKDVRNGKA